MGNKTAFKTVVAFKGRRMGFSLVELLVAMALIIFMLSIMSQAFVIATTAMSGLKNITDMIEKIRPVMATLERDLNSRHFEGTSKRLSDASFWENGPPTQGYFMVWQDKPNSNHNPFGSPPVYQEGVSNNVGYALANEDANHMIAFTVRADESNVAKPDDFFALNIPYPNAGFDFPLSNLRNSPETAAPFTPSPSYLGEDLANFYFPMAGGGPFVPPSNRNLNFANQNVSNQGVGGRRRLEQILCDWMEVAYFIRPSGRTTEGGVPLCTLYRQNRFILPHAFGLNGQTYYLRDVSYNTSLPYLHNISHFTSNSPIPLPVGGGGPTNFAHSTWPVKFNTPGTVTQPWRRMGVRQPNHAGVADGTTGLDFFVPYNQQSATHPAAFTDVFLDNVLSFEIKLQVDNVPDYRSLWEIAGHFNPNVPPLNNDPETANLQSYPGPHSSTDPRLGFTRPVTPGGSFNSVRSDPFWKRGTFPVGTGNKFYDRVVFDTWTTANRTANADNWVSTTTGGAVLEQGGPGFIYPKPSAGTGVHPESVEYDPGIPLDVTGQDVSAFTAFPSIGAHPFYSRITNRASLDDLLSRHAPRGIHWQPTPGPGNPGKIPIFSNSYTGPALPPVYFPKGPRIYSIQVSIRVYDEKTKSAKEFRLIARL